MPNAQKCAETFEGRKVSRFFVTATQVDTGGRDFAETTLFYDWVTARSGDEAVDWVRDQLMGHPNTTIKATGPRGGRFERFIGWHSVIAAALDHRLLHRSPEASQRTIKF